MPRNENLAQNRIDDYTNATVGTHITVSVVHNTSGTYVGIATRNRLFVAMSFFTHDPILHLLGEYFVDFNETTPCAGAGLSQP